jgi:hypothetical protein
LGFWTFVLIAAAISTFATIINNWTRARHGYPLEEEGSTRAAKQVATLIVENGQLKARLSAMEERLRVVERIATDPAERTARQIEELRHQPDA